LPKVSKLAIHVASWRHCWHLAPILHFYNCSWQFAIAVRKNTASNKKLKVSFSCDKDNFQVWQIGYMAHSQVQSSATFPIDMYVNWSNITYKMCEPIFFPMQKLKAWERIKSQSSRILPIAAQVKSAEATPIKTFPAFPCYSREAGQSTFKVGFLAVFAIGPIVYGVQRVDGALFFGHLSHQKSAKMDQRWESYGPEVRGILCTKILHRIAHSLSLNAFKNP
jgi:hypothetical protein